jgi:hypothetical protein
MGQSNSAVTWSDAAQRADLGAYRAQSPQTTDSSPIVVYVRLASSNGHARQLCWPGNHALSQGIHFPVACPLLARTARSVFAGYKLD